MTTATAAAGPTTSPMSSGQRTPAAPTAEDLVVLYDEARKAAARAAADTTPVWCDAVLDAHDRLDAACAQFAAAHYGEQARVIVGLWTVMVYRRPGVRRAEVVLDRFEQYRLS